MMVVVNVFAIVSAALFYFRKISPLAFLISSMLWFFLMIMFWFILPNMVYRQSKTFKDFFRAILGNESFAIENDRGHKEWGWNEFSSWKESPHFFHLYFNPKAFFIIPKESFGEEENEARKILTAKIKK